MKWTIAIHDYRQSVYGRNNQTTDEKDNREQIKMATIINGRKEVSNKSKLSKTYVK
ncbi:MAG: hypothetical protein ACLSCV_08660 [Acutalibacteraceae bacterium]